MEWYDIEVDGRHTVKFADLPYVPLLSPIQSPRNDDDEHDIGHKLGGIIRQGEWAWSAKNSMLQIVSLRNGQTISMYEFCESRGYDSCCIKCVEEIFPNNAEIMILAVVLESFRGPGGGGSYVVLYSIELSSVLSTIELGLHATCARFMDEKSCRRSLLQNFDGCLAVGSEEGVVVLLDLNIRKMYAVQTEIQEATFVPCHIVDFNLPFTEIHRNFRQCQQDGIHFGLQMEVIESPCSIQSILPIDLITAVAIGLEDGRMALYDLAELQIFYVAIPKRDVAMSAVVKMDYLEPPDDPRPCLYIWTLHENGENLHAVLHNLMYEKRLVDNDDDETINRYYFESFQTCSVRMQLPLEATKSVALACQTISTLSSHGEDDSNCLCAISWFSVLEEKNKLLIFDLNQWYKEEMPFVLEFGQQPSYLAGYVLNGHCVGLHTQLKSDTIAHFNSMQRFEEHFYPNSLSFDCSLLHTDGCRRYNWEGAQNRVINLLRVSNASIFLEPNNCFNEILRARLMPQFTELNLNSTFSRNAKYEIMLSTALEHNCVSLLRDCGKSWIDGSFMGDFAVSTGLALSTLTDWIWQRATAIKSRCNDLCKGLFEFGGYPLDQREQKELGFITRQLKLLYDLMGEILVQSKKQIPGKVYSSLENNYSSLRMASNYQDLLLWLLNIGLLPEASPYNAKVNASHDLVPYPYKELKDMYKKKRLYFAKIKDNFISKKSGSCRLLYIDAFIDHACKGNALHEFWLENDGDGLYPPNSIEAMLRVMLVPELEYEDKYAILLYFFLDLNMAIDEEAYKGVVANFIKFPSVFKLSAALIKTVQSFWNLDHDQFLPAVDEFISPFNKNQSYPQWQVELLVEALLTQSAANLALRILESQPSLISPMLQLKTLLANELISEAFHYVRSKHDDSLLDIFFTCCLRNGQFGVIRDLALNEREGMILQNILKCSKAPGAESLHFVYLLQKSKYIEAVSYMDELSSKVKTQRSSLQHRHGYMDTPNMVLSAFNTTMTPVTQGLTDVYFRIKNKIKKKEVDNKSPVPLSCQLIKQNANNLLGGIYHSSALSAHFATYYWGELAEQKQNQEKHLLNSNNAPFLRRPQIETSYVDHLPKNVVSYPQAYKVSEKRTLIESEVLDNADEQLDRQRVENQQNPKKKRRLIGQEIVDDLTHFMRLNKQKSINLNANEFKFLQAEPVPKVDQESINSMEMLTRPLATKPTSIGKRDDSLGGRPEIQGILKTNTPDSQAHVQEEEKYLRFRLPSVDLNYSEVQREEVEDDVEEMDQEDEKQQPQKCAETVAETSSLKVTHVARATSEESIKSTVSSTNNSEENFYSPLSSQNNSKLDCSNISSRSSFISGPKPRKPLARLSAEPEIKVSEAMPPHKLPEEIENIVSITREISPKPQQKIIVTTKSKDPSPAPKSISISINASESLFQKDTSSSVGYATALGTSVFNISSRKPIESISRHVEVTEEVTIKTAYVTAYDSVTNFPSSSKTGEETSQTSSGFGSISARSTLTGSEFLPKVSSSKVGFVSQKTETSNEEKSRPSVKISECTTVVGSFDYTSAGSHNVFALPSMPVEKSKCEEVQKHTEEQKRQMLETTLGMSTYDISVLDSTSLQPTKSCLMVKAEEGETSPKDDNIVGDEAPKMEHEQSIDPQVEEQMEVFHQKDVEPPAALHVPGIETKNPAEWGDLMNSSDDDCIVLSSSSSYIDDNDYGRPFDFRSSDEYDDEGNCDTHAESEKSFDTGEYDDYGEDVAENEEDSIEIFENGSEAESRDVVEIIDDSSSDAQRNNNLTEESDSGDVRVIGGRAFSPSNHKAYKEEMNDDVVVSTTTSIETAAPALSAEAEVSTTEKLNEVTSSSVPSTSVDIEICINENVTTSTTDVGEEETSKVDEKITEGNEEISQASESVVEAIKPEDGQKEATDTKATVTENSAIEKANLQEEADNNNVEQVLEEENKKPEESVVESAEVEEQITLRMEEGDSMDDTDLPKPNDQSNLEGIVKEDKMANEDNRTEEIPQTVEVVQETNETYLLGERKTVHRISKTSAIDLQSSACALSSPRRNTRGSSVPPLDLDVNTKSVASPRRNTRGTSIPPSVIEPLNTRKSVRGTSIPPKDTESPKGATSPCNEREISMPPTDAEAKVATTSTRSSISSTSIPPSDVEHKIGTVNTRRGVRGNSVPPLDVEPAAVASPRRNTRGISVPPQVFTVSEEVSTTPTRTRRSLRASSLQPTYKIDEETTADMEGSPRKRGKTEGDSENTEIPSRSARGSSMPPGKTSSRRRSVLLDAINEDIDALDSPSAHTRFRSRINSMESEMDQSIVSTDQPTQAKRSRKTSWSNAAAVDLPLTPKRSRRSSISSQSETNAMLTPRNVRARSVLSTVEDESESIASSPKPITSSRKVAGKRKSTMDNKQEDEKTVEYKVDSTSSKNLESPKGDTISYSTTSRRLTRTQLAMMEKSVALSQTVKADVVSKEIDISPPAVAKRPTKARSTRSTAHDSDDTESVSSKRSATSSAANTSRRRVTRKSVKDKEDHEDDAVSVASSAGSEKHPKLRHKDSPNSTLPAVPEDVLVEAKKRGRPTKH